MTYKNINSLLTVKQMSKEKEWLNKPYSTQIKIKGDPEIFWKGIVEWNALQQKREDKLMAEKLVNGFSSTFSQQ